MGHEFLMPWPYDIPGGATDQLLGVDAPELDPTQEQMAPQSTLQRILAGFSGLEDQNYAPRSFGEGLVAGIGGGLGRVGTAATKERALLEGRMAERQKERNKANLEASRDYRKQRGQAMHDLAVTSAKDKATQAALDQDHPTVDDAMIARHPEIPGLKQLKGQRVSRAEVQRLTLEPKKSDVEEAIMTPDAIDARVSLYLQGQGEPGFGMGKAGVANRVAFNNRLGQVYRSGGIDPGTSRVIAQAERTNLTRLTGVQGGLESYGGTLEKNLTQFENALKRIPDTGMKPTNWLVRNLLGNAGSVAVSNYETARQPVVNEISRILNNATLTANGTISDSARKEIQVLLDPNSTVKQIRGSIQILRNDYKNRTSSNIQAIRDSQDRIRQLGQLPGQTGTRGVGGLRTTGASAVDPFETYMRIRGEK